MRQPAVGYRVLTRGDTQPGVAGFAYDYLLASNGVFVVARGAHLGATVRVAEARVRGLREAHASLELAHGRIDRRIWAGIVAACAATRGRELLCEVAWADGAYRLRLPRQAAGATRVLYARRPGAVLQLHSHHRMPAYFSVADTEDEQGLGLYGVVGGLGTGRPQVLLRVGIYGHFQAVPWDAVFDGRPDGFVDLAVDAPAAPPDPAPPGERMEDTP